MNKSKGYHGHKFKITNRTLDWQLQLDKRLWCHSCSSQIHTRSATFLPTVSSIVRLKTQECLETNCSTASDCSSWAYKMKWMQISYQEKYSRNIFLKCKKTEFVPLNLKRRVTNPKHQCFIRLANASIYFVDSKLVHDLLFQSVWPIYSFSFIKLTNCLNNNNLTTPDNIFLYISNHIVCQILKTIILLYGSLDFWSGRKM